MARNHNPFTDEKNISRKSSGDNYQQQHMSEEILYLKGTSYITAGALSSIEIHPTELAPTAISL